MNHETLIKNYFHWDEGCGNYQLYYTPINYYGKNKYTLIVTNRDNVYDGHMGEILNTEEDLKNYIDFYFKIAGLK